MSSASHRPAGVSAAGPLTLLLAVSLLGAAGLPAAATGLEVASGPDHLVISELVTGGASASDELVELYNPTAGSLPLEGLELVYVSASGLTVSRRVAWELGAPEVPAGHHVLVANELGVYAPIADAVYASGMAATGGSVALRIVGASSAIDALSWGSAASTWLEGRPAPSPAAGASLERLPGGVLGSTRDTDDNASDFATREVPQPENSGSPPVPDPTASGSPVPTPTGVPTLPPSAAPSPVVTPSPGAGTVPIATARALPDGAQATVEGTALTGSAFTDGGGYIADASGGIAVLLSGGSFARGELVRVTGELDDRYAQRTIRADAADVVHLGTAAESAPAGVATGTVGEGVEGRLVRIAGTIVGSPTTLTTGVAFAVDDGSGETRLLVATTLAIDVTDWGAGVVVEAVGVVGQRDSTGTGTSGYRVQPRDGADVIAAGLPSGTPSASSSARPTSSTDPSPTPGHGEHAISVAAARQLPKGAKALVRGIVTMVPGVVDPITAVIQDSTGAIVLRVSDEVGSLVRGSLVEVEGVRSTKSGMETLRVTLPPRHLGAAAEPVPSSVRTGEAGESHEAALVLVRGGLVGAPRRSTAGTISFEIDDGSGPLRVSIGATAGIDAASLEAGTWIEVRGVLGQDTTGSQPLRGYRVWPREAADLRITASATDSAASSPTTSAPGSGQAPGSPSIGSLDALGGSTDPGLSIGATLVSGPWPELGVGGLLWDGTRMVALEEESGESVAALLAGSRPPIALEISGLRATGVEPETGMPMARAGVEPGSLVTRATDPAFPRTAVPAAEDGPQWASLVGRLAADGPVTRLLLDGSGLRVEVRCHAQQGRSRGTVAVTGIALADPPRLIVPCAGIVPAPALVRPGDHGSAGRQTDGQPVMARLAAGQSAADRESPSSGAVAGLLAMAATTLLGGVLLARRAAGRGEPEPPHGESSGDDADDPSTTPVLTLVPVPRERAP